MPDQLTEEEYLQVSLVTRHESYSHCRWPPDVLRAIAEAQIFTTVKVLNGAASPSMTRHIKSIRSRLRLKRLPGGGARGGNSAVNP